MNRVILAVFFLLFVAAVDYDLRDREQDLRAELSAQRVAAEQAAGERDAALWFATETAGAEAAYFRQLVTRAVLDLNERVKALEKK